MNNNTLLSIIIPYYNGSKYIKQLIKSVLDIPIENKEVIIVDDGSKDSESEILKQIISSSTVISYYRQENQGIVGARNSGLDRAKGKYLLFCDQDDKVNPNTISEVVISMVEQNADAGFYSTRHFDDKDKEWDCDVVYKEGTYREKQVADVFIRKLITRYAKGEEVISYIGHLWGCVIRRQIVIDNLIQFKKFMSIEDDLLFVLDVLDYSSSVVTTTKVGYYWRSNRISMTSFIPYVENINIKMKEYYQYRTNILKKHGICDETEMYNYLIGMRQEFLLNLLLNEALKGLKNYILTYHTLQAQLVEEYNNLAIMNNPKCPLAIRMKTEMKLLRNDKILILVFYAILKVYKRKIKNIINRFIRG